MVRGNLFFQKINISLLYLILLKIRENLNRCNFEDNDFQTKS